MRLAGQRLEVRKEAPNVQRTEGGAKDRFLHPRGPRQTVFLQQISRLLGSFSEARLMLQQLGRHSAAQVAQKQGRDPAEVQPAGVAAEKGKN